MMSNERRVESNRRAREEAGTARQPRGGDLEDLPVGEPAVIDKLKGEMVLKKRKNPGLPRMKTNTAQF